MNPPCAYVPVGEVVTDAVAGADGVCVAVALMVAGVRVALRLAVAADVIEGVLALVPVTLIEPVLVLVALEEPEHVPVAL